MATSGRSSDQKVSSSGSQSLCPFHPNAQKPCGRYAKVLWSRKLSCSINHYMRLYKYWATREMPFGGAPPIQEGPVQICVLRRGGNG